MESAHLIGTILSMTNPCLMEEHTTEAQLPADALEAEDTDTTTYNLDEFEKIMGLEQSSTCELRASTDGHAIHGEED